jgi:hypothetical protein
VGNGDERPRRDRTRDRARGRPVDRAPARRPRHRRQLARLRDRRAIRQCPRAGFIDMHARDPHIRLP